MACLHGGNELLGLITWEQGDTSSMTYDMIMNMFKNLPKSGNYFDSSYWQKNIQKAMFSVEQ